MSDYQDPDPVFDRILASGHDPADGTIALQLGTDQDMSMEISLRHSMVGGLVAVLAEEMVQLLPKLDEEDASGMLAFAAQAVRPAVTGDGTVVLLVEVSDTLVIPLALPHLDMHRFAAELYELTAPKPSDRH